MTLEVLYLFAALATLSALGIWVNIRASDLPVLLFSFVMVIPGVGGMLYLVAAILFGWDLPGGAL